LKPRDVIKQMPRWNQVVTGRCPNGGYRLFDVEHNAMVYGGILHEYGATLDEIEHFLRQLPPRPPSS
jgi:hypothetical protein